MFYVLYPFVTYLLTLPLILFEEFVLAARHVQWLVKLKKEKPAR
jgi:hypothetical protein